jgi:hypothetical protein
MRAKPSHRQNRARHYRSNVFVRDLDRFEYRSSSPEVTYPRVPRALLA